MSVTLLKPPYKNASGNWLTNVLFWEHWYRLAEDDRSFNPVFSFAGREGFIDIRRTFVEMEDPTGYKWAMKYLTSYKHWEKLMATSWFPPHVEDYNREIKAKLRAEAFEKIRAIAGSASPQAFQAAKFLHSEDWESTKLRGRPSKMEVTGELKRQVTLLRQEDDDAARIGLKKDMN